MKKLFFKAVIAFCLLGLFGGWMLMEWAEMSGPFTSITLSPQQIANIVKSRKNIMGASVILMMLSVGALIGALVLKGYLQEKKQKQGK